MPESENQPTPDNGNDGEQPNEPTFNDVLERATFAIGLAQGRDAADTFEGSVLNPEDLLNPDFDEHLATIRAKDSTTADALEKFRQDALAEQKRVQEVEEKEARDTRKDVLRALPANERVPESDVDRELLEELAQEEFAASPAGQVVEQATEETEQVKELLTGIRTGHVPFEESYEKVQEILLPAWQLADVVGDPERSTAERVDAWEEATPIAREMATRWFGIVPTFDIDVDSDSYREGVEARRKANREAAEWAATQVNLGGD